MIEASAGLKSAELLGKELSRLRWRRDKARVASRILSEELERVDAEFAVALNAGREAWPDPASLQVPAWDTHREALATLLDDHTWDAVKAAVTLPGMAIARAAEDGAPGDGSHAACLQMCRMSNALARAKLVTYTSKPTLLGFLSRARHDDRTTQQLRILNDE